ncbi:VOC family protein [Candidatus Leptofilum sp.]|uniref:VOC family protein n=1 Tax=Candidatus Leptofilum sp. TaxID=3241576 RepID=UPI003B5A5AEC
MSNPQGVKFIYLPCNNVQAMRHFYSELLRLNEIYFDNSSGGLAYNCDGLQFTFFSDPKAQPISSGWAWQPGWRKGDQPVISWSVSYTEEEFRTVVDKLKTEDVISFYEKPHWHFYWSFPVKDPMGNTVEIVWAPEDEPKRNEWH